MMDKNLDHDRAKYAYGCIEMVKNIGPNTEKSYRSAVLSSGTLIHNSGLMQTLAFYLSKKVSIKEYTFKWSDISDTSKNSNFLKRLKKNHEISWIKDGDIKRSKDNDTIKFFKDENSAEITIDEGGKKAKLKISDGRTHELLLKKTKSGVLNICDKDYPHHYELLAGHILHWNRIYRGNENSLEIYHKLLDQSDEAIIYKTQEAKALVIWLKRFAEAMLEKGEDDYDTS